MTTVEEEMALMDEEEQSVSENEITANLAYINVFKIFYKNLNEIFNM
jgi:hypothetical protein